MIFASIESFTEVIRHGCRGLAGKTQRKCHNLPCSGGDWRGDIQASKTSVPAKLPGQVVRCTWKAFQQGGPLISRINAAEQMVLGCCQQNWPSAKSRQRTGVQPCNFHPGFCVLGYGSTETRADG